MTYSFDSLFQEFTQNPDVISLHGDVITIQHFVDDIYACMENHMEYGDPLTPQESYLWDYLKSHKDELTS